MPLVVPDAVVERDDHCRPAVVPQGSNLGPFEIVGAGGTGEVYRARDRRLGREVAIKVGGKNTRALSKNRAMAAVATDAGGGQKRGNRGLDGSSVSPYRSFPE